MRKFSNQRGPEAHHSILERVQAHFGFTQQEIADVLGVSRGALTMAASNRRSLPPDAWMRLLQFQQALPVAESNAVPAAPAPVPGLADLVLTADDRQDLDLRRRTLLLQATLLGEQLARHQTRLAQARLRLQALPSLRAAFPADDEVAQSLFKVWQNQAAATLRKATGPLARLALRQAVLAFEAGKLEKLLADNEGG
ncbi:antitoxin Xre-like helix-turn-helix domain-containing protein [Hymenobacter negativus]|uniref:XRE family transcriptional regulator n=1 Tax=Hymenobacter negativus TaxID=2795026 RepID=A0ABS3QQB2_9BACT|nr:hypothetical protein [Hymenobacter negativus]MBO2013118.1 hypothetical protein [Hymenobacter negativus]